MFPRLCIFFCETDGTGYFMSFCNKRKKGQQLPVLWRRHPNTEMSFDPSVCSMMANCMISKSSLLQNTGQNASKNSPLAAAAILPSSSLQRTHIIRIKSKYQKSRPQKEIRVSLCLSPTRPPPPPLLLLLLLLLPELQF